MKLGDLLPNPIKAITAPFKKREGQPWLQGTARNLGHAAFGDKVGNYVDERILGDVATQAPKQNTFSTLMTNGTIPIEQTPGKLAPVQAQLQATPGKQNTGQTLLDLIQTLSMKQGGM